MRNEAKSEAYDAGWDAFAMDRNPAWCPYLEGSQEAKDWECGHNAASREHWLSFGD